MDQIQHKFITVRGLKLHVAEIGSGPKTVIFLHGFPEVWYSWRHQMLAVSEAGFRAIAPDYRGYGLSEQPADPEKTKFADLVEDTVGVLDSYGVDKAFVVGKDFGVRVAYLLAKLHPERVEGVVTIGLPMAPLGPPTFHQTLPEGFYILRWQVPGRAEADFGRFDEKTVVRKIYISFAKSEIPIAAEDQEVMDLVDPSAPLPPWLTEDDMEAYGALYEKSGFRTALQVPYRSLGEAFDITDPRVEAPALLILGEKDYCLKFPGMEDYVNAGRVYHVVPNLEIVRLPEGCHFVQEQFPEMVNSHLISFLAGHV
uniref:AB hydrolase-1 domain-containing protein n=1 Tax=Kalanchoe fedtschenkoi TaxID=63787 RepID=A0A7N0TKB1_KALFE